MSQQCEQPVSEAERDLARRAREFAEQVIRNDATPLYLYNEARLSDGERPRSGGARWLTPAELARDFLGGITPDSPRETLIEVPVSELEPGATVWYCADWSTIASREWVTTPAGGYWKVLLEGGLIPPLHWAEHRRVICRVAGGEG